MARLASVSTATVSYVLNNAEGRRISARTREEVHRAAELLGYRPNLAARNLARGKSGVVLYVVPHVAVGEMPMEEGEWPRYFVGTPARVKEQLEEMASQLGISEMIVNTIVWEQAKRLRSYELLAGTFEQKS